MKKLAVDQLKIGMNVIKLDKGWLDTPFLKHNFVIKSEKHLLQLRKTCEYVFVKSYTSTSDLESDTLLIEDNENKAKTALNKSFKLLNIVIEDFQASNYLCTRKVKEVVNYLTLQVLNDSKTYEYLNTIQSSSPCIAHKSLRVLVIYLTLCKYLGIKKSKLLDLGCAALLHDIGMIKLSISVDKPGKLTSVEREQMINHTQLGVSLIEENKEFPSIVAKIIKSHHEHFNGSGYPLGIAGRDINLYSRMLTLVCTYEALTRNRRYKSALDSYSAISELARVSGSMLDPRLVARFIEILQEYPAETKVKTTNGDIVKVLAKLDKSTYQITSLSSNNESPLIVNSETFEGVIYE